MKVLVKFNVHANLNNVQYYAGDQGLIDEQYARDLCAMGKAVELEIVPDEPELEPGPEEIDEVEEVAESGPEETEPAEAAPETEAVTDKPEKRRSKSGRFVGEGAEE